jgi:hypothetical protein
MEILKQLFTGKDNATLDLGRILWAQVLETYILVALILAFKVQSFSLVDFATGAGLLLTAGGIGVAVKAHTEPEGGKQC